MTLTFYCEGWLAVAGIDGLPIHAAHIDVVFDDECSTACDIVDIVGQPSKFVACFYAVGFCGSVILGFCGGKYVGVPPLFAYDKVVDETFVNFYIYGSTGSEHVTYDGGEPVALYRYVGVEVAFYEGVVAVEEADFEMDGLLLVVAQEVVYDNGAVGIGFVVPGLVIFFFFAGTDGCGEFYAGGIYRAAGCVAVGGKGFARNGVDALEAGAVVVGYLEVVGHGEVFVSPVGGDDAQFREGPFQGDGFVEIISCCEVLGAEVGVAALVVHLCRQVVDEDDVAEVGGVVVQVGSVAFVYKVGPGYEFIVLSRYEPQLVGYRLVARSGDFYLRADDLRLAGLVVDGELVAEVVHCPVDVADTTQCAVACFADGAGV